MRHVAVFVAAAAVLATLVSGAGCRMRTVEPDDYQPGVPGHLNPVEARQFVTLLLARHGIKLQPNSDLNLRGVRILADGFDQNLHVGYVYLLNPPPGTKLNFEVQSRPTAEQQKVLEKIEKTEYTYIAWIDEGNDESIRAQIEAFTDKLYRTGALAKAREPKKDEPEPGKEAKEGGETKKDEAAKDDAKKAGEKKDDEPKKHEKSKVMQMIEDESEKKDDE